MASSAHARPTVMPSLKSELALIYLNPETSIFFYIEGSLIFSLSRGPWRWQGSPDLLLLPSSVPLPPQQYQTAPICIADMMMEISMKTNMACNSCVVSCHIYIFSRKVKISGMC